MHKQKTKKLIIFAIPSLNEADTIGPLTKIIDAGLYKYFKDSQCIIINSDNDSPDNTKEAFLKTPTKNRKIYLTSKGRPKNIRGKGFHMKMVFEYAEEINADAVGFIDGDVISASPEWVRDLISPILEKEYDHILPIYRRNEYDGSITNHLAFPVLYGFLGRNIRQPLAGEIGLSKKAIKIFLSRKWYNAAYHYGVDIFMVTQSIFNNLCIGQTFLGSKSHKPSAPKLDPMFLEVADSLLRQLKNYKSSWKENGLLDKKIPVLNKPPKHFTTPEISFSYKKIKKNAREEFQQSQKDILKTFKPFAKIIRPLFIENNEVDISADLWARIVRFIILKEKILSRKELSAFRVLFLARFLTFYKKVIDKTHDASEKEITKQAKIFKEISRAKNIQGSKEPNVISINPAILVIDIQNCFVAEKGSFAKMNFNIKEYQQIIKNLKILTQKARELNIPLLFSKAIREASGVDLLSRVHKILAKSRRERIERAPLCVRDSWDGDIIDEIKIDSKKDYVFEKRRDSAFYETELKIWLRALKVDTLIFTGIDTSICVESTLRDAFNIGYDVILLSDATASRSKKFYHSTLEQVKENYGLVMTLKEFFSCLKKTDGKFTFRLPK